MILNRKKVIVILFLVLFLVVSKYVVSFLFFRVKTENCSFVSFSNYIDSKALILRDEFVLTCNSPFVRVVADDNFRVAKGQDIAFIYDSEEKLDEDSFDRSEKVPSGTTMENIDCEISKVIRNLNYEDKNKDKLKNMIKYREKLISTKNISLHDNYTPKKLYNSKVVSDFGGIFSYFVDGFESELSTLSNIGSLNFDKHYYNVDNKNNYIGKIITGNKCLIVCKLCSDFKYKGNYFNLKFNMSNNKIKCKLLRTFNKNNNYFAVFVSDLNPILINTRCENVKIEAEYFEGLKIRKDSVLYEDSVPGVYVLDRKVVKFKKINMLYENNDFVICEDNGSEIDDLKCGDLVIYSGKNLYDGKVLMY